MGHRSALFCDSLPIRSGRDGKRLMIRLVLFRAKTLTPMPPHLAIKGSAPPAVTMLILMLVVGLVAFAAR